MLTCLNDLQEAAKAAGYTDEETGKADDVQVESFLADTANKILPELKEPVPHKDVVTILRFLSGDVSATINYFNEVD